MKAILSAIMIFMAASCMASTNYVFTGATNSIKPSLLSKCLIWSGVTNTTLQESQWSEDDSTITITYGEPLSSSDWLIASNTANWFVTNTSITATVQKWNELKTNYNAITTWENRFMLRFGQANGILLSEGLITSAYEVATVDLDELATNMIVATNASASSVGIALDECYKWSIKVTLDFIGPPPDGSEIRKHIKEH